MKRFLFSLFFLLCGSVSVHAAPFSDVIADKFWGGDIAEKQWCGLDFKKDSEDSIGKGYQIGGARFRVENGRVDIKLQTNYKETGGSPMYGNLFISTNGWNPFGSKKKRYRHDSKDQGEDWEFVLDNQGALYSVDRDEIIWSDAKLGQLFRYGQEVAYDSQGQDSISERGEFSIGIWAETNQRYINYSFFLADLGLDPEDGIYDLGFHWTMGCGNDVMEFGVRQQVNAVPLPGSLLLLGSGMAGLFFRRSRRA